MSLPAVTNQGNTGAWKTAQVEERYGAEDRRRMEELTERCKAEQEERDTSRCPRGHVKTGIKRYRGYEWRYCRVCSAAKRRGR